jgi:hypothetical protein
LPESVYTSTKEKNDEADLGQVEISTDRHGNHYLTGSCEVIAVNALKGDVVK